MIIATVIVGSDPIGVGVNSLTNEIYVANFSTGNVSVIDGPSNTIIATIMVGSGSAAVGMNP